MQGLPVFQLQAPADIAQADSFRAIRQNFPQPFRSHADAVVCNAKAYFPAVLADVDRHPAAAGLFPDAVLDGVFDERLQQ